MIKYSALVFLSLLFFACTKKATIETELVKSHIINVEDICDTTNILQYLGGIPYTIPYGEIHVSDNRLLRFYGIPFKSLEIAHNDGRVKRLSLLLFKDLEVGTSKEVKNVLTDKLGEPKQSEYDENVFEWKNDKYVYELEVAEEGYSNNSKLTIKFGGNSYFF